jgi:glycosyltransferase involved in cell wall biosynthesis
MVMDGLRALLVSYAFPPTGGAGVQRVLKLAQYLPDHGVTPAVLTVSNPSVPLSDQSLEIPSTLEILRARTFEPSYGLKAQTWKAQAQKSWRSRMIGLARKALVPDPQILWQPAAQATLARRFATRRNEVIFISAPPFSQFLLAPLVRLGRAPALVLDYRDEWTTLRESYEMGAGRWLGDVLEPRLLRMAHAITTATEAFRQHLLERFPFLRPERVVTVPNGYDRSDIPSPLPAPPNDRLTLTYAGTLFRLTSPTGLLAAIRRLHARSPELTQLLRVRFIGRIVETERAALAGMEAMGVECTGYLPHRQMMNQLAASHLVLCLLDDVPGAERIYPAKIFELMALGRPCLTLAPDGALTDLVRECHLGDRLAPRDEDGITQYLEKSLRAFRDGQLPNQPAPVGIDRYDRRVLAGDFARVFEDAIGWAERG